MSARARNGSSLLLVMLAVVTVAGLAMAGRARALTTLRQIDAARSEIIGELVAESCLTRLVASTSMNMQRASTPAEADDLWRTFAERPARNEECTFDLQPLGKPVAIATDDTVALFNALHAVAPDRAASLLARLHDWMDEDSVPRVQGAENAHYDALNQPRPSNRSISSHEEFAQVVGDSRVASALRRTIAIERHPRLVRSAVTSDESHALPDAWLVRAASRARGWVCVTVYWRVGRGGGSLVVQERGRLLRAEGSIFEQELACR